MADPRRPGAGPSSRLTRSQILQAARRYYDLCETQAQIAKDMGISASYLARVLKAAKERGWVRVFVDADRETELAAALMKKFPQLVYAEVVPTMPTQEQTAAAIGTVAARWLDDLLDRDQENEHPRVRNIAVGGSAVMREMVEQLARRERCGISVGPTALTPSLGRAPRFTAPMLATLLAFKLGAVRPASMGKLLTDADGSLYTATVDPPYESAAGLAAWFEQLEARPGYQEIVAFWERADVVFIGAVPSDWAYKDVAALAGRPGFGDVQAAMRRVHVLAGNRYYDDAGKECALGSGLYSMEPCMRLRPISVTDCMPERMVVAETWGKGAADLTGLISRRLVNVVMIDVLAAEKIL